MISDWFINIILRYQDIGILEYLIMTQVFSEERLQQLEDELKFTLLSIGVITREFNYFRAHEGNDVSMTALDEFKVKKVKLQVEITALEEFLGA